MNVEKLMGLKLAGEIDVLGKNQIQGHFFFVGYLTMLPASKTQSTA
jgi:hypothetical protein